MKKKSFLPLLIILLFAFILRLYGIDWDQGAHLHPDERMLIMVAEKIHFFDNLNPDFFNYGSLPIYALKGISQTIDIFFPFLNLASYNGMLYVGRYMSIFADLTVIFIIFKTAKLLFKEKQEIALFACFFYSICFFAIQNTHFFVVDVFLNLFIALTVYLLILFVKKPCLKKITYISISFAAALAVKITAIIMLPVIVITIIIKVVRKYKNNKIFKALLYTALFSTLSLLFFFIFMPYAFFNYHSFLNDISSQITMNSNPYIFPYTLQYIDTLPYLYYLKNIFIWGLGPIISCLSLIGIIYFVFNIKRVKNKGLVFVYLIFYIFYFLVMGRSSVKFMRYMLILYPFLAILASGGIYYLKKKNMHIILYPIIFFSLLWTLMFVNIYSQKHTRIAATEWINNNIERNKTIAVEHWDDRLPIYGSEKYTILELRLYELPDDEKKWKEINNVLDKSDYIIIASNRLYTPLQRLNDCKRYEKCYPKTSTYYKLLFNEELGFKKQAEFSVYPKIEIGNFKLEIVDNNADESFTVYDHPKIMIFKKSE